MVHVRHKFNRKVATRIEQEDGMTKIYYHETPVVSFNADKIVLDSGGWRTVTTKRRMNEVSREFGLDFDVSQRDFRWFVTHKGKEVPFDDYMELKR